MAARSRLKDATDGQTDPAHRVFFAYDRAERTPENGKHK